MHESPRWWASILAPTTPHTSSIYYARNTVIAIRHHACMQRPRLGVDCACTTYNWHELRMHRTNSPQSCLVLSTKPQKTTLPPLPFSLVMRSLPASFLSFLSALLLVSSCMTFLLHCLIQLLLLLASRSLLKYTYRAQWVRGISGLRMCAHKKKKKKKTGKTFPERESVSVPRQGTSKRPRQGLASVPRQGTGKRTQAGYWQASQAGTANVPRQGTVDVPRQGTVAVPRQGTVGTARKMHSNDLPPTPRVPLHQPTSCVFAWWACMAMGRGALVNHFLVSP